MKTRDEIQRLHDTLDAILSGEIKTRFDRNTKEALEAHCIMLCWVLQDERGQRFDTQIERLYRQIAANGYVAEKVTIH